MAESIKQSVFHRAPAPSTTHVLTLPAAPTSGNLLIVWQGVDKTAGTFTNPTGFQTPIITNASTSVSLFMSWKVSDGTETSITMAWSTSSPGGGGGWYAEIEDTAVTGTTWELLGSATNPTTEATATSWSSGTTGTLAANGYAQAGFTVDTQTNVGTPQSFTNTFTQRFEDTTSASGAGIYVADKLVSSGTTAETTMSHAGSTDQLSGAIGVWRKVASAPPAAGPALRLVRSNYRFG